MKALVCIDRDGTINLDENYYLGSSKSWKKQVEIIEGVVEGIRSLNDNGIKPFILTNQSGVALRGRDFDDLTEERMHEVNNHILDLLSSQNAFVAGYFACPFVDLSYVEKARLKGRDVNSEYVDDSSWDLKPRIGMVEKAARSLGMSLENLAVYVIGDRKSDVELGLNAGGKGILVASQKTVELGDVKKVNKLSLAHSGKIYVARNFLEATKYIISDLRN
ncbi:MAG: HAD-IIIA family hydrolase [Nanoarchaeota archaeon]|nr:HAD-IIIA family hydrolase [Nanoarchaeota archaeon]